MSAPSIPVHHLHDDHAFSLRVERIQRAGGAVRNDIHRHDFHEIFFFERGTGTHMIDLAHHAIQAPCAHLVAPGQVHKLDRSADTEGSVLMFTREVAQGAQRSSALSTLFRPAQEHPTFALSEPALHELRMLAGLIEQEQQRNEGPARSVAKSYLEIILAKCAHWMPEDPAERDASDTADAVTRFLGELENRFLTERSVSAYAELLAISAGHLNGKVKKRLGRSAGEVINERVMLEAKRLLLHADLTVKEVGFALHMEDPAYFNRVFKKATGSTPLQYRRHVREKYQR